MRQNTEMLRAHVAELESLLSEYLHGDSPRSAFQIAFAAAVGRYSQFIQARPYWPLVDIGEYGGPEDSLRKFCAMALERLPREELDRETRYWIEENLIDGDEFSFFHSSGVSKFRASRCFYRSEIDGKGRRALSRSVQRPTGAALTGGLAFTAKTSQQWCAVPRVFFVKLKNLGLEVKVHVDLSVVFLRIGAEKKFHLDRIGLHKSRVI